MADVRVMILAVVAACGSAGAQPEPASGVKPPAGWQALPPPPGIAESRYFLYRKPRA